MTEVRRRAGGDGKASKVATDIAVPPLLPTSTMDGLIEVETAPRNRILTFIGI